MNERDPRPLTLRGALSLLARRPDYRRLWTAEVVSYLGDWLAYVAVSLVALDAGEGLLAVGLVLVAHSLPHAIIAPIAGVVTDRFDRRALMIGTNVVQGLLVLGMVAAAAVEHVWALQGLLFLRAGVSAFFVTAQSAALPRLVGRADLEEANALASLTWSVMFAFGVALGGVLSNAVGPTLAIAIDAVTFFVAAGLLATLPKMQPDREPSGIIQAIRSINSDLRRAWSQARSEPPLLEAILAKAPLALAAGGAWVLMNHAAGAGPFMGSAALTLGAIQTVRGVGTGVGPLIGAQLRRWGLSVDRAWAAAAWLTFFSVAGFALIGTGRALLVVALIWGLGVGANWVMSTTRLQQRAPDAMLGRLSAMDFIAFTTGQSLAALAGGALADWTGEPAMAAWLGLGLGVFAWFAARALVHPSPDRPKGSGRARAESISM